MKNSNNAVLSAVNLKGQNFFLLKNKSTNLQIMKRDSTLNLSNLMEMQDAIQAGVNDECVDCDTLDGFLEALDENTSTIKTLDVFSQIKSLNQIEKILLPNKEITV
jgi:hypothetical protein